VKTDTTFSLKTNMTDFKYKISALEEEMNEIV